VPHPAAASRAAAAGIANVVVEGDHVASLVGRGGVGVVLERKMSGHEMQVNARIMSSCVSNARRRFVRRDDESARRIVTRP
jgi:cyanophycinase-like exopeptidase